jgi:hypothetical protein
MSEVKTGGNAKGRRAYWNLEIGIYFKFGYWTLSLNCQLIRYFPKIL